MRVLHRKSGFSLVELLTVIAIIAILAAIIFPVMTAVQAKAKMTKCMTQLHTIGTAMAMFKTDNRKYPDILGPEVMGFDSSGKTVTYIMPDGSPNPAATSVTGIENAAGQYLFSEYVKTYLGFHCPMSKVNSVLLYEVCKKTVAANSASVGVYAFDSYDAYTMSSLKDGPVPAGQYGQTYTTNWATGAISGAVPVSSLQTNVEGGDSSAQQTIDYQRQLMFRNPPQDTVVTWCSNHEGTKNTGWTVVLFLDNHVDTIHAAQVRDCKWRIQPNKQ